MKIFIEKFTVFTGTFEDSDFPLCFNLIAKYWKMKSRVQYKKKTKIEICYQGVITTPLVTCNFLKVQSMTSLIMQIRRECLVQVKVYSQKVRGRERLGQLKNDVKKLVLFSSNFKWRALWTKLFEPQNTPPALWFVKLILNLISNKWTLFLYTDIIDLIVNRLLIHSQGWSQHPIRK